jgi:hypothetical protein
MSYRVTAGNEEIGTADSADSAIAMVEQHFECGIAGDRAEVKKSLRMDGYAIVVHCLADHIIGRITKA